MKKTLVLVVDRDNDFGIKGKVKTPVIGPEAMKEAASMLGTSDPEDSDVNTVYAAIKIYNDLKENGADVEVAMICGDTKVGYKADMKVADELDTVMETVAPNRAILVSDGAEDEFVYPMISSRVKIDSKKKVYVKQAPGLESAFYSLLKIIHDKDKRKRLFVPIGVLITLICAFLMLPVLFRFHDTGDVSQIFNGMGVFIMFALGVILLLYAYGFGGWFIRFGKNLLDELRLGDPTAIFTIAAIAAFAIGIILGISAATAPALNSWHRLLIFFSNSLWVIAFAYICNDLGRFIKVYIEKDKVVLGFLVGTLMILAAAFIIQATIDILSVMLSFDVIDVGIIFAEYIVGSVFAAAAAMTQISYKHFMNSLADAAEQSDVFQ